MNTLHAQQPQFPFSDISLTLERYEDIFSIFDQRDFSERSLSDDFLIEAKKASIDKNEVGLELILRTPKKLHSEKKEAVIKDRLRHHFMKHYHQLEKEKRKEISVGVRMIFFGILFLCSAAYIYATYELTLPISFLIVFLEPAGWFLSWEGMNQTFFTAKKMDDSLTFYRKMAHATILFKHY